MFLDATSNSNVLNHFAVNDSHHDMSCVIPSSDSSLQYLHANITCNTHFPNSHDSGDFVWSKLVMCAGNVPALRGRQFCTYLAWRHQSVIPKMIILHHLFVWKFKFCSASHMASKCSVLSSERHGLESVLKAVTLVFSFFTLNFSLTVMLLFWYSNKCVTLIWHSTTHRLSVKKKKSIGGIFCSFWLSVHGSHKANKLIQ